VGALFHALALPFSWVDPVPEGVGFFILIGLTSGAGNLERVPASRAAPFGYTRLPWAVIFGVPAFDDVPDVVTLIGLATVIAGRLLAAARGRR
jgi:drug/metabolite transporter (DMT)-like permease